MTNEWTEIQNGFESIIKTENVTVQFDYFPVENYAQMYIMPPKGNDGITITQKIRFRNVSACGPKEEMSLYQINVSLWDSDENDVSSESTSWMLDHIELKNDIEDDENPSENDKKVFEFFEKWARTLNYNEELESAQAEGFFLPEVYEEDE